jgi:acetylornithine/N-succinyldiaminopimelate aminotransferase
MIWALVLTEAGAVQGTDLVKKMLERGYLINFAGNVALRFIPPLIVSQGEIDRLTTALAEVFAEY